MSSGHRTGNLHDSFMEESLPVSCGLSGVFGSKWGKNFSPAGKHCRVGESKLQRAKRIPRA